MHLDDWDLFRGKVRYDDWEARALAAVAAGTTSPSSQLHDCYGHHWLDGYSGALARLGELGEFRTLDEVAADVMLAASL